MTRVHHCPAVSNHGRMTGAFMWTSCTTLLEMSTKPVNMRATTATRTGCARHGVDHKTPFSGSGSRIAAEDLRPNILQLNTEGFIADKISVIEQLAYKHKAFIIVLQETHCTTADKTDIRQCLFILHGQRKDPEVIKVS